MDGIGGAGRTYCEVHYLWVHRATAQRDGMWSLDMRRARDAVARQGTRWQDKELDGRASMAFPNLYPIKWEVFSVSCLPVNRVPLDFR